MLGQKLLYMVRYHYEGGVRSAPLALPDGLKVPLGRKTTRKVRAVEVPFGGSKRKISSGAPKWVIQLNKGPAE